MYLELNLVGTYPLDIAHMHLEGNWLSVPGPKLFLVTANPGVGLTTPALFTKAVENQEV